MSKYPIPGELIPKQVMTNEAMKQTAAMMPANLASAVNLMAHPLAGASAMTALGVGVASQAVGMWLGAMCGAAAASQRLFMPMLEQAKKVPEELRDAARTAEMRAVDTASALIADAKAEVEQMPARPVKPAEPREEVEARREAAPKKEPEAKPVDKAQRPARKPARTNAQRARAESKRVGEAKKTSVAEAEARTVRRAAVAKSIPADKKHEELAPKASRKPATVQKPKTPDDLKEISGIGPKLEQVLNSQGIWTFEQIAGWSKKDVDWVEDMIGMKGRIIRDSWIPQAEKLAKASK